MSSPNSYTLANRFESETSTSKKRASVSRSAITPKSVPTTTSIFSDKNPNIHFTADVSVYEQSSALPTDRELLLFVYLDLQAQLSSEQIEILRAINDDVRIYHDEMTCYEFLHSCTERIFFICATDEKELFRAVHDINTIDAIFLISSSTDIDRNRLSKVEGIYTNFESITVALKNALEWYEEAQMNLFSFEHERTFIWCQLWREELIKPTQYHSPSNKEKLVEVAEIIYQDNPKVIESLRKFDQSYSRSDALQWCFYSPFPSRLLHQALRTRQLETLDQCRFLISEVSRILQQSSKHKSSTKLFRGMRLSKESLDHFEECFGQLICFKDYFTCTKSRKVAIAMASAPNHRPDLLPVLFKITADKSCPVSELSSKNESSKIIFDFYTAFRVKYVVREGLSTVKLECAVTDGKTMAKEYLNKYGVDYVTNLLNHTPFISNPIPRRLPPVERASTAASKPSKKSVRIVEDAPDELSSCVVPKPENEERVKQLIEMGDIDGAIDTFKRLKHVSATLLASMGSLYVEKKGDYDSAIKCFNKALKLKDTNDEDPCVVLNQLAMAHENRQEFDIALSYHSRALEIQQKNPNGDKGAIVSSMLGIANGYCGQENYSKGLKYAKEALEINETIVPRNDVNLAMNHAIIASIHHRAGNTKKGLKNAQRALTLLESSVPSDSPNLAALLNNVATMQLAAGRFSEARESFDRALKICEKTLPEGHPKRVTMENNLQRIIEMEKNQLEEISVEVDSQM